MFLFQSGPSGRAIHKCTVIALEMLQSKEKG